MKRGWVIWLSILAVIIILIIVFWTSYEKNEYEEDNQQPIDSNEEVNPPLIPIEENSIEINSEGFSPQTLNINVGDTVTWTNNDNEESWPATAMHPSHKIYPGSSISKCGTSEEKEIFDACHGIENGESYSFTFNEVGSWNYHDHLNPSHFGTIIVS